MRLIEGAASATAFIAAVASVGFLNRFGQPNTLGLALVSTLIVAGAVGMLHVPAPFEARFSRPVDWWRHGADFGLAAVGLWAVVSALPASRDFLCEPLVPWRISIALFGAFAMSWLARAVALRAPKERSLVVHLPRLLLDRAVLWLLPRALVSGADNRITMRGSAAGAIAHHSCRDGDCCRGGPASSGLAVPGGDLAELELQDIIASSLAGDDPNILRMTLSASASKQRPSLSTIRCGCHEWISSGRRLRLSSLDE